VVALVAALVVVGVVVVGTRHNDAAAAADPSATISVAGTGTVHGTPDTVNFGISVSTTRATAEQALYANDLRIAALQRVLKRHGVTRADMEPSGLSIYELTNPNGSPSSFTVNNTLNVTLHGVDNAGPAIEAAAKLARGAMSLTGISFSISNDSKLLAAARAKAIESARGAAAQIASAGNVSVGNIVSVTDHEFTSPAPPIYDKGFAVDAGLPAIIPTEAGSQAITVQVSVVYDLSS
jgi:uncharacterized protein YggE